MHKQKPRSPSWEAQDLAWKIPAPKKRIAHKLFLVFIAKHSNNNLESWHGYVSIQRITGIGHTTINEASKYWRDLGILEWQQGGGYASNRYKLNLEAMRALVEAQEDASQVSADRNTTHPQNGGLQVSADRNTPSADRNTPSVLRNTPSADRNTPIRQAEGNSNGTAKGTHKERPEELGPAANSPVHPSISVPPATTAPKADRLPPLAAAPQAGVNSTRVLEHVQQYKPIPGCEFRTGDSAGYWRGEVALTFDQALKFATQAMEAGSL